MDVTVATVDRPYRDWVNGRRQPSPTLTLVGSVARVAAGTGVLALAGAPTWAVLFYVLVTVRLPVVYVRGRRPGDKAQALARNWRKR